MAKAEKKVLGLLPRSITTTLLLGLVAVIVLALIWSWVMVKDFSTENASVVIIEFVLLAILIGAAVGFVANNAKASTLWIAAGLTAVGLVLTQAFIEGGMQGAAVDQTFVGAMYTPALSTDVILGYIVLGIIAAAAAAIAAGTKDVVKK